MAGQDVENCVGQEVGHPEPDGATRAVLATGVQLAGTDPEPLVTALEVNGFTSLPPLACEKSQVKVLASSCWLMPSLKLSELREEPDL